MLQQLITDNIDLWTTAETPRSSSGRGSKSKTELTGIKKLRELILELAVRGLLVPQDPNDEPASVLLEKVAAEKAQLVKDGKIKKQKPLPEITEDEKPFDLPDNWKWARLGNISRDWGQKTPDSNFTYIDVSAIDNTTGIIKSPSILSANDAPSRARKLVAFGTVLYSTVRPYLKNICVIEENISPTPIASTAFAILHPLQKMPGKFFSAYLRSPVFVRYVESVQTGIAYPAINDKQFFSGLTPIPPLAEQHRIVAKVDELMALCDRLEQQQLQHSDTHHTLVTSLLDSLCQAADNKQFQIIWSQLAANFDTLFTTEASIDQLKQTLLQLAVMGKLVPQDPNDEPASILLEKIATEKAALIKEGKIKRQKPLPEIAEDEKPFDLPDGWEWVRFVNLSNKITDGAHHTPTYIEEGIPFLSVKDMSSGELRFHDTRFISEEQHNELFKRCNPERGDLLLTKVGTTGIPILIDTDKVFSIFVSVALIKFNQDYMVGKYLSWLINSPFVKKQSNEGTEGIGNKNLVLRKIAAFVFPIPPLEEQHRIVAKVDELMALCDQLKHHLNQAQTTQQKLAHAVVEQSLP